MPQYIAPPPMNPLSRLLAGILAVLALAGAFFFGFDADAAFFGARFFLEVDLIRLFFPMKNPFEFVFGLAYSNTE